MDLQPAPPVTPAKTVYSNLDTPARALDSAPASCRSPLLGGLPPLSGRTDVAKGARSAGRDGGSRSTD